LGGGYEMQVGTVSALCRYPVKSFGGEALDSATIDRYGMRGDRTRALTDMSKTGWRRYVTARQLPQLLAYQARFIASAPEAMTGDVAIVAPDGRQLAWDNALLAEIQTLTLTELTMETMNPDESELLAVDDSSLLIATESSLRKLQEIWGQSLDLRRFRANLIVSLHEDYPFAEADWIGKRLTVGDVELQIEKACERCVIITIDPNTQEKDPSLLKLLHQERDTRFGVYASVVRPGTVRNGDGVHLS